MAEQFVVAYNGQLAEGKSLDAVKQGVAQLFKVDVAKIEHLFNGQWASIKKGLDQASAEKYRQALARAGALCRVVSESQFADLKRAPATPEATAAPVSSTSPPAEKPSQESRDTTETELVRSVVKAAPAGFGELEGAVVEASWDHVAEPDDTPPPQVDLTGVALAEKGGDLVEHQDIPDLDVDTSEFSLDALGVDMAEHEDIPDLVVDTSEMVLDELGVDMSDHKPVAKPDIDISGLSLEQPR